jgi:hypothetical protein
MKQLIGCGCSVLAIVGFFGAVAGFYFFKKSSDLEGARARVVTTCGSNAACNAAVAARFDECFTEAYVFNSGVVEVVFAQCMNGGAASPIYPPPGPAATPALPTATPLGPGGK